MGVLATAALTGAASGLASLLGQTAANSSNLKIARETNAQNYQMFKENQSYNSAAAQVERLKAAGLNPNLAYGDLGSGMQSVDPTAVTGAPMQNVLGGFSDALSSASQLALLNSQAKKNIADANYTDSNTDMNKKALQYYDQFAQGALQLQGVNIDLGKSNIALNESQRLHIGAQISMIDKQMETMDKQMQLMDSQVSNLDSKTVLNRVDSWTRDSKNRAQIQELLSSAGLDDAQSRRISELLGGEKLLQKASSMKVLAEIVNVRAQKDVLEASAEGLRINNKYAERYGDWQHILGLIKDGSEIVTNLQDIQFRYLSEGRSTLDSATNSYRALMGR